MNPQRATGLPPGSEPRRRPVRTSLVVAVCSTTALLSQGIAVPNATADSALIHARAAAAPVVFVQATTPDSAYAAADAAYKAYSLGNYTEAVHQARKAVVLAPDNVEYRRLLETAEDAV